MFDREDFEASKRENARKQAADPQLTKLTNEFLTVSDRHNYFYQWTWCGLPLIQLPADIVALQELVWTCQPDVVVETGIAWGGSMVFFASIMELVGKGRVIGVDVVLPDKNREAISRYPFSKRIELVHGSSIDPTVIAGVKAMIKPGEKVMVILDSNHTHEHVLEELRAYAPLVSQGQYLIVSDTIVEDLPPQTHRKRPWGPGNNPKTALRAYMQETDRFEVDQYLNDKILTTCMPDGYVRCIK